MAGQTITKEFQTVMDDNPELQAYINANPNYMPDEQMQAAMIKSNYLKKERNRSNYQGSGTSFTYVKDRMSYGLISTLSGAKAIVANTLNISSPYEMGESSRLNQAKLKQQCERFKTAWETDIDNLTELSNVFSQARENSGMVGKTGETFFTVMDAYCLVIQCLQLAKLFSIDDSDTLYNRLGDEDLVGSEILKGIRDEEKDYNDECRLHDACLREAPNHQDYDPGYANWLRSEAARHGRLAENHYDAWMVYLGKKKEYEDINAFSAGLYLTGEEYRNCAQNGMDSLEKAFDGTGNYVVPDTFEGWYNNFTSLNEEKFAEYASKWKDENGEWDMEKLGEVICIDDDSVSYLDCMAMCYVFDDIYQQEDGLDKIATLMSSSYIGEFSAAETSSEICAKGYWTYRPSETYCRIVSTYGNHLNATVLLNNNKCKDCTDEFQTYNLLRAGVVMSTVVPDADSSEDLGHFIQFDISLEEHNTDGYIELNFNARRNEIGETAGDIYTSNCRVYEYSGDISGIIDDYSDYYHKEVMQINTVKEETKMIITTAGGFIPGVGQYITVGSALASCIEIANDADAQSSACETMLYFDDVEDAFDEVNVSGSIIIKDNEIIVTAAVPGEDELSRYVDDYNNAYNYGPNDKEYFRYNPNTFAEQYMTSEKYRMQFDLFVDYVDTECKAHG